MKRLWLNLYRLLRDPELWRKRREFAQTLRRMRACRDQIRTPSLYRFNCDLIRTHREFFAPRRLT